jgi:hypothetical protein
MTGMFRNFIRHSDGRIEECVDLMKFAAWFNKVENQQIARTAVPYGAGDKKAVIVLTRFLGMDHNWSGEGDPVLFETAVFADDDLGSEFGEFGDDRYRTEVSARAGHGRVVALVQESLVPQQEVDAAIAGVLDDDDELPEGLKVATSGPHPIPPPRRRKLKDPLRTAADPTCNDCRGGGKHLNSFGMAVMCECTIVRRK